MARWASSWRRPYPDPARSAVDARFREHKHAEVIASMPGIGPLPGAEFLAATGGDMTAFDRPDRLAGVAPLHVTRARSAATCTGPDVTADASSASSTPPH